MTHAELTCSQVRYKAGAESGAAMNLHLEVYRTDIPEWTTVYNDSVEDGILVTKNLGGVWPLTAARFTMTNLEEEAFDAQVFEFYFGQLIQSVVPLIMFNYRKLRT